MQIPDITSSPLDREQELGDLWATPLWYVGVLEGQGQPGEYTHMLGLWKHVYICLHLGEFTRLAYLIGLGSPMAGCALKRLEA